MTSETRSGHKWWALALLCASQFMVVLDVAIVNVALPVDPERRSTSRRATCSGCCQAYTLDVRRLPAARRPHRRPLGRRRVFMVGLLHVHASPRSLCGLAQSEGWLIAARAVQGLGAAIIAPAALSIVTTTFAEGAERNKALGVWGAIGGAGAAVGVLAGGDPDELARLGVDLLHQRAGRRGRARC